MSARRAKSANWVEDPETFVIVGEADRQLVGYAFVTIGSGYASWDSGKRQAQPRLTSRSLRVAIKGVGLLSR